MTPLRRGATHGRWCRDHWPWQLGVFVTSRDALVTSSILVTSSDARSP